MNFHREPLWFPKGCLIHILMMILKRIFYLCVYIFVPNPFLEHLMQTGIYTERERHIAATARWTIIQLERIFYCHLRAASTRQTEIESLCMRSGENRPLNIFTLHHFNNFFLYGKLMVMAIRYGNAERIIIVKNIWRYNISC